MKTEKTAKRKTAEKPSAKIEAWEWPASPSTPAFFQIKVGNKHYGIYFSGWSPISKSEHRECLTSSLSSFSKLSPAKARKVNAARLKGIRPW